MKSARFLVPLAAVAVVAGCGKHEPATVAARHPNLPPARVEVTTLKARDVSVLTETTGTIRPVQRATLAAKVMGIIEEIPVSLGGEVHTGDVLVRITAGETEARVAQAKAQLNQTRRDLERERTLLEKQASTPDMVRGLEDRLAIAEAMVHEAEVMAGYTTLRAPFDGVVARKLAEAGDLAAPGMPLLEIEGAGLFEVEAGIPDSQVAHLAQGTKLTVTVPSTGTSFEGELTEISPAADRNARTVPVRIRVPGNAAVRSGQFVRVQVPGASSPALLVPASAVSTLGQMDRVFVVADGRAVLRLVQPGQKRGNLVEILTGLAEGDTVVVNPPTTLREGQALEVQP